MTLKNIILDFGHGGLDENGHYTTYPNKMFKFPDGTVAYEGVLNKQIGGHLYTYLRNHSELNTVCTVAEDDPTDVSLQQRVRFANQFSPLESIFISLHCNAGGGTGFELFTSKGTTRADVLAEIIANHVEGLYEELNMRLRYDLSDGDKDKEAQFFVLRETRCPAVLLECGFFDHPGDFEKLTDPKFQSKLAYRIYQGILDYGTRI